MRHGESEANIAGIIVSDPESGCNGFGLTDKGREQVEKSIRQFSVQKLKAIITSDFLRARQTAEIAANILQLTTLNVNTGLRERWFGEWEGKADIHYEDVWMHDEQPDEVGYKQVENVESVLQRGLGVINQLEKQYENASLLLVSHGDMLQILRTAFEGLAASKHRQLPHHQTAEIIKYQN